MTEPGQKIILVLYCKIFSMDAARRCGRCEGKGRVRMNGRMITCPRCKGDGLRPDGWAYTVTNEQAAEIKVGDIVECPPTPYTNGQPTCATVVAVDGERWAPRTKPVKPIIRRVGDTWPAGVPSR